MIFLSTKAMSASTTCPFFLNNCWPSSISMLMTTDCRVAFLTALCVFEFMPNSYLYPYEGRPFLAFVAERILVASRQTRTIEKILTHKWLCQSKIRNELIHNELFDCQFSPKTRQPLAEKSKQKHQFDWINTNMYDNFFPT